MTPKSESPGATSKVATGAGIVKAACLTIPHTAVPKQEQTIPGIIALHLGQPFLADWEGGAR